MTRDDLLKALAEKYPDATGEDSLRRVTTSDGKSIFSGEELKQTIMEAREVEEFLAICQFKREFNNDFDKLGEFLGKAATIAVYYQVSLESFLKVASRAFRGAEEYQNKLNSEEMN